MKVKQLGDHATFLNLDMTIKWEAFIYDLFNKRDPFPLSIVRMSDIKINVPQKNFYSAIKGKFLRVACSPLCPKDFIPKAKKVKERIKEQDPIRGTIRTSLKK